MDNFYTGIGSRKTPADKLMLMTHLAQFLAQHDFILRSGGANGADEAFEKGCDLEQGSKEIYIPWNGFNGRFGNEPGVFVGGDNGPAQALAAQFHPNWAACTAGAKLLHGRNGHQVLGHDLATPSQFILCWTPGGSGSGGTGQALRISRANNIPIFDLGSESVLQDLQAHMVAVEAANSRT